jgi:hypothetical protein
MPRLPEAKRHRSWIYLTFPSRTDVTITGAATDWRVKGDSGNEKNPFLLPDPRNAGLPYIRRQIDIP